MYKFGFNFFTIIFQFAPCMGQSKIMPGQTGLHKKRQRYNKFYFLKPKLLHKHHCYLKIYHKKYFIRSGLEHKTQVNATCDSSGPAHSSH